MSGQRRSWRSRAAAGALAALLAAAAHANDPDAVRADIVFQALSLLGTPYRYGGTSPSGGLDCSGLVRHVYAAVLDRDLPRRSEEISAVGHPVSRAELQAGDLVFFNTLRRAFSHVAIYIGDGRFVHAPARAGHVRIEALDDRYWATRFNGARRVIDRGTSSRAAGGSAPSLEPRAPSTWVDAGGSRPPEP